VKESSERRSLGGRGASAAEVTATAPTGESAARSQRLKKLGDAGGELGMATPALNSGWQRDEMLPASRSNWSSGVDGGAAERHVRRRSW